MAKLTPVTDQVPVAIVYTSRIVLRGEYVEVEETLNTPFTGKDAKRRAVSFKDRESATGDFPLEKGWHWHVWANQPAIEEYADWMTDILLGPESGR